MIKRTPHLALQLLLTALLTAGVLGADHSMAAVSDSSVVRCLTPFLVDNGEDVEPGPDAHAHPPMMQAEPRPQPMPLSFVVPTDPQTPGKITDTDTFEVHTYESESGRFRLVYTTEGPDSVWSVETGIGPPGVPDYIVLAAQYADSSYRYQVEQLGYTDPLNSTRCIVDIGPQIDIVFGDHRSTNGLKIYGYFDPDTPSHLYVNSTFADSAFRRNDDEDDFAGIPGVLGALKVTIAHELKHAIQYATNCFSGNEINIHWLEMDATMMENVVFPNVNDYYNYIGGTAGIFGNPHTRFPRAYSHVTFMLYYHEDFGPGFWVDVWEEIGEEHLSGHNIPMLEAMERVIEQHRDEGDHNATGESVPDLEQSLLRNYLWHLASGNRALLSYGFSEREDYPTALVFGSYDAIPDWPGPTAIVNYHSARFFEFRADEMDAAGDVALALFNSSQPLGIGFLGKTNNGEVLEYLVKAGGENRQKLVYPVDWSHLDWLGMVAMNTVGGAPVNRMQLLAGEGSGIERIPYGNITKSGELSEEDAGWMLSRALNPAAINPFDLFLADVSGNGEVTPYDASRVLMNLENGTSFPADDNQDNLGPEWSRFESIGSGDNPPAASLRSKAAPETWAGSPKPALPDTVTAELVLVDSFVNADQEMDLTLRVTGLGHGQDGHMPAWSSLLLEMEIDFPPEDGGMAPGDPISLQMVELLPDNSNLHRYLWEYDQQINRLRLAVASSGSLAADPYSAGLLTLRLIPKNEGLIHFRITDLRLDENTYAMSHPVMDTIRIMKPVHADGLDEANPERPLVLALEQNYPNPFNPETVIRFTLPESGHASLHVYDITGRRLATLVDGHMERGEQQVRFDAREAGGITSGVYLYRLTGPGGSQTQKMTVVK